MKNSAIFIFLFFPNLIFAQRNVVGKVTTNGEEPLIGATIRVIGTNRGAVTDIDGNFSISIPRGSSQLEFAYSNYNSKTVIVGASNVLNVSLNGGGYSTHKRWSLGLFGGHTITSSATTTPIGITRDYGGKYWGGIKMGYDFVSRNKIKLGMDIGSNYRDYGFKENGSTIPYLSGFVNLHLRRKLFWRISLLAYGGGEYAKLFESKYSYSDPSNNSMTYNVFLHQNDALTVSYGGGLSLSFNRLGIDLGFERNLQMDTFDKQYGKTIGGRFSNVSLYYYLF